MGDCHDHGIDGQEVSEQYDSDPKENRMGNRRGKIKEIGRLLFGPEFVYAVPLPRLLEAIALEYFVKGFQEGPDASMIRAAVKDNWDGKPI